MWLVLLILPIKINTISLSEIKCLILNSLAIIKSSSFILNSSVLIPFELPLAITFIFSDLHKLNSSIIFFTVYAFVGVIICWVYLSAKKDFPEIEKATTFYGNKTELLDLKKIIKENRLPIYKSRFIVKLGKKTKIIRTQDIECFFSSYNST